MLSCGFVGPRATLACVSANLPMPMTQSGFSAATQARRWASQAAYSGVDSALVSVSGVTFLALSKNASGQ